MQWCIAGFAPCGRDTSTLRTMNSYSLVACSRLSHDATNTTQQAVFCVRRQNDVTRRNGIGMPSYGPLCAGYDVIHETGSSYNVSQVLTAAIEGPSHGHAQKLVKIAVNSDM